MLFESVAEDDKIIQVCLDKRQIAKYHIDYSTEMPNSISKSEWQAFEHILVVAFAEACVLS